MTAALCIAVSGLLGWVAWLHTRINLLAKFACCAIEDIERHDHQVEMLARGLTRAQDRADAHKWN